MQELLEIDLAVMRWINVVWVHPWLDLFFLVIASFHIWKWPLAIGAVIMAIWGGFRARVFLVLMLLCLLIGDSGINWSIKRTVDRPRPHESVENLRRVRMEGWKVVAEPSRIREVKHGNSMTSGHACNNFALATLATILFRPWGMLVWIWASGVAYSRIYTADHFPSDILVSLPVAVLYTLGIVWASRCIWKRYAPRYLPQLYERHPDLIR
ncbi:MAG: phosphatase PAP2 family protein [Candidatus Methylacidiphilales bacterium]